MTSMVNGLFFEILFTCQTISRGQHFKIYIMAIRGVLSSELHDFFYIVVVCIFYKLMAFDNRHRLTQHLSLHIRQFYTYWTDIVYVVKRIH